MSLGIDLMYFMYFVYVLYLQLIGCVSSAYVIYLLREKDDTSKYQLIWPLSIYLYYTVRCTISYLTNMPLYYRPTILFPSDCE